MYYEQYNLAAGLYTPSMIHPMDNALAVWYAKYLLQDALSVFEWTVPENWDKSYMQYILYLWGYVAVVDAGKFGVIPQQCTLQGVNIFYRPTHVMVTNPLIPEGIRAEIGTEGALLRLQPDYSGIGDIVSRYAGLMAMAHEALAMNLQNSKSSKIFATSSKSFAESIKKMYDQIAQGSPITIVDKDLLNDQGELSVQDFESNLKNSYIGTELTDLIRTLKSSFDTEVGLPNANTEKKERLIVDEVNQNNVETYSKPQMWLESLQEGCEQAHEIFGLTREELWVDWRNPPTELAGPDDDFEGEEAEEDA